MPPRFISAGYSHDELQQANNNGKLFGRRRTIHQLFGGGKVADIVLWRNKHLSGAVLVGVTVTWFLFEVVEYHFLTLLCQLLIAGMLLIFIWSNGAALLDRSPPNLPEIILSERTFREFANYFHARLNQFLVIFQNVAMGRDLRLFLLTISSLSIISIVGSFFNTLNLLYLVYLGIQILPALYERYEREVDHLALMGSHDLKKLFHKIDTNFLDKIPRGPVKEKKYK